MGLHANCRRLVALCACLALAGACTDEATSPAPETLSSATPAPIQPSGPPERSRGCTVRRAAPPDAVPHYDMSIDVDPGAGVVTGRSRVTFVADRATRRLVFRLWPNGPRLSESGAELVIQEARLGGGGGRVEQPNPTTLVFDLGRRLPPGETTVAKMRWRLDLPGAVFDRISQNGDSIRLGSFFPILSWEGERGWATDPATTSLAESSTSPTADFDVEINVPRPLSVIATGREKPAGEWVAEDVRDFGVAVARFEQEAWISVDAPHRVNVIVGVAAGLDADPQDFAQAIERALRDLARRYGPYPWRTFSMAIMPDLGSAGIEYPTMIFQGEDSLRNATTHEVAHSWFYGLVGNDQGRDPWLDEGITSWAQARADGDLGYFRDFEIPETVAGRLGRAMTFWDRHQDDYYAGVYVQGVKALDALGDARRVDCALKRYVAENAYDVATTSDLVDALEQTFPRAERALTRFGVRP